MNRYQFASVLLSVGLITGCVPLAQSSSSSSLNPSTSSSSTSSSSLSISSLSSSSEMTSSSSSSEVVSSASSSSSSSSSSASSSGSLIAAYQPTTANYDLVFDESGYVGIPATGNVKALVFAVDFSDYPSSSSDVTISDIQTAFNGTAEQTDYESLNSYYLKSSYGQLNLTADVVGFYRAAQPSTYYEGITDPEAVLIDQMLKFYNSTINYNDYDANDDGYIDIIYVMYSRPYDSESNLWWAYQYYTYEENTTYDGLYTDFYVWMSMEFLLDGQVGLDARTIIHESGHALGLEDYYDYDDTDNFNSGGLGGADMMDYTVGDHGPFSKLLLGWRKPHIVTDSITVRLEPYETTGQMLLVTPSWSNSIFDEYLLISYYTPTGLYEPDSLYYFTLPGITIYHVDAHTDQGGDENSAYYSMYNNNNSDTPNKLIRYIEQDQNDSISDTGWTEDSDLFVQGDSFAMNEWYKSSWSSFTFIIEVLEVTPTSAVVRITRQ